MGIKPNEFWTMSWKSFMRFSRGFEMRKKNDDEALKSLLWMLRFVGWTNVAGKKGAPRKPEGMLKFEWERKDIPKGKKMSVDEMKQIAELWEKESAH